VVASTDFTHYGHAFGYVPFREDVAGHLKELDGAAFEHLADGDLKGFWSYLERTGATICGRTPVSILLAMLPEDAGGVLLKYDTSGRMTGKYDTSVSYGALAFAVDPGPLDRAEQRTLLNLARDTLRGYLNFGRMPRRVGERYELTPRLRRRLGTFVTLEKHEGGRRLLRGCIGSWGGGTPTWRSVVENAVAAATRDHRFPPVTPEELAGLELEISVMSAPRPIAAGEVMVGRHGLVMSRGRRRGVLLPQVPVRLKWDRETFLAQTCRKAGLEAECWRDPETTIQGFTAQVFGEGEK